MFDYAKTAESILNGNMLEVEEEKLPFMLVTCVESLIKLQDPGTGMFPDFQKERYNNAECNFFKWFNAIPGNIPFKMLALKYAQLSGLNFSPSTQGYKDFFANYRETFRKMEIY